MAKTKWPRPTAYKSFEQIVRANNAKEFYVRYMEPSSVMYGVQGPDKSYKWYEYDPNVRGFVLRATTLWRGPANVFPASQASKALAGLGAVGEFKIPWMFVAAVGLTGLILWVTRPIKA